MVEELESILNTLHSKRNKIDFLQNIYTPGNTPVADLILSMAPNPSVLKKEIAHARDHDDEERFADLSKKFIDYYVEHKWGILIKDEVIKWGNPEAADYSISKLASVADVGCQLKSSLEYAVEIAEAFGKVKSEKRLLENLLQLQKRDSEFKFPAARTLVKLGRFDEAIDCYIEASYGWFSNALRVAREHAPQRVEEIARKGFHYFDPASNPEKFYVECAGILGKTEQAEKTLLKHAKKVKIDSSPRCYGGLVESLVKFGREKEAKKLVDRVAKREEKLKHTVRYYEFDRPRELATLYHFTGEVDRVRDLFAAVIDERLRERHHPSHTLDDIHKAIEFTGDEALFLSKKIELHEQRQEYKEAEGVARQLGKLDLAQVYSSMQQMIEQNQ